MPVRTRSVVLVHADSTPTGGRCLHALGGGGAATGWLGSCRILATRANTSLAMPGLDHLVVDSHVVHLKVGVLVRSEVMA